MFEWNEGEKTWMAAHHPFTSPHEEDMAKLESGVEALHDPLSPLSAVRALAYDVVLNGTELGSGSIRIHRQDVQSRIFRALGMTEEEARARFGFFLEALEYGTPPHGGHRARPRPHSDDSGWSRKSARSDSIPEDGAGGGSDGRCAHAGEREAAKRVGDLDS